LLADDEKAREIAGQYLDALADEMRNDPDAFGLHEAIQSAGDRLVATLESLQNRCAEWFPPPGEDVHDREIAFLEAFVQEVAGEGTLMTDTAIRQAALTCGKALLGAQGPVRDVIQDGTVANGSLLTGELFCLIFELFFKDAIARFITTIIAGKVRLALPLLHVIDPAGKIADWVGEQVVARIPDPCEQGATLGDKPSLSEFARGLVAESVDRALGISATDSGAAAA
jgi:hypothetical protein